MIINLGHLNSIEVIIEGVENQEQVDTLSFMGIDTIQGFYYCRPLSFEEYQDFLKNNPFEVEEDLEGGDE